MTYELETQNKPYGAWKFINSFEDRSEATYAMEAAYLLKPLRAYRIVQNNVVSTVEPQSWSMKGAEKI